MSHTLLVWEEIPEDTKMYLIPNEVAEKHEHFLKDAHNQYINLVDWENHPGLFFLNTALSDEAPEPGYEEHQGIFKQYQVSKDEPLTGTITKVYLSGFIL